MGAFPGRPGVGRDRRWCGGGWTGQGSAVESSALGIGDDQPIRGPGEGDAAAVMQPVVERADEYQVVDKSLIHPSPVGSFILKGFHWEPTLFGVAGLVLGWVQGVYR